MNFEPLEYFENSLNPMIIDDHWDSFVESFVSSHGNQYTKDGNRLFSPEKIDEKGQIINFSYFDDFNYFLESLFAPELKKTYRYIDEIAIEYINEFSNLKFQNIIKLKFENKINSLIKRNVSTINRYPIYLQTFKTILEYIQINYSDYLESEVKIKSEYLGYSIDSKNYEYTIDKIFSFLYLSKINGFEIISKEDYGFLKENLILFISNKNIMPLKSVEFKVVKNNLLQYLFGIFYNLYSSNFTIYEMSDFISKLVINFSTREKKNTLSKKYSTPPIKIGTMQIPDFIKGYRFK